MSPLTWVITIVTPLISPLITTHEPPSTTSGAVPGVMQLESNCGLERSCHPKPENP